MMRMRTKAVNLPTSKSSEMPGVGAEVDWELRPGGMLVQKRNLVSDQDSAPAPVIKIRVKHGSSIHEVFISSQATFGELKKQLSTQTGLHPQDQKLLFKDKERDNTAYLDLSGVKDRSKIVLVEDPTSQERRYLEMRRNAKMEKAAKSISEISLEVDKLAGQVSSLESLISRGRKVAENDVMCLIELLMSQLIKLDGIMVDGDAKLQRRMQVRRVQKCVETLDLLKIKNATPNSNRQTTFPPSPATHQQSPAVVVTTKWETFDSTPAAPPSTSTTNSKLNWEFFE
ncbi:BAG family molecular chaperone regulator 1-like [Aristolochia californica]|uniref:BAG family molecular chaperone regulator 1-like n=1 Tax=Aristolochia californica TaxID=171875 RepID=UPI0035E1A9A2